MTDMSDIEDGFSLKRRRENARAEVGKKKPPKRAPRGEHPIPPPPAKHILASFTLANLTSKRSVSDYVETQARGEKVLHAERVKTEHILGRDYDCWDVHTDRDRYWVITSPTNLYSQHYFPSLDYTLSFHVGVSARIMVRSRGAPDDVQKARLTPPWRRWEQAAETLDESQEAEDFQSVGMRCRECLIQLVRSLAKPEMIPVGEDAPQRSNFISWSELIANSVAAGESAKAVRSHLKSTAKSAWDLAAWLTHANGATRLDAVIVLDATHTVLATFGSAVIRHESRVPDRCPNCGSYNLDVGFNPELRAYMHACEECGWQSPEMR
jgi:predicted RNA-binding Zn-ribbon protein involved in translation (DUF1610 family)